ncbi:MAG: glutathione S-transferase N-terminal domain-containing protein [Hyphomicrobiaceae bacterium]|nr:glutathione S-transferase N-terminal domain-containing protein [Hyphomicrobiaceae bacterium]
MKLYITPTSPYARVARIVVLEKLLSDRVEIVEARTRTPDSPYYRVNPSGRVPFLVTDDGVGMEDSGLIAAFLDRLDGRPSLTPPPADAAWAYGRLESYARSLTDGISVWVREMRRPEGERSPTILAHELARGTRLADFWEREIGHPAMQGPLNLAQLLLLVGLDFAAAFGMAELEKGRPKLAAWCRALRERPSVAATAPSSARKQ